MITWRGNDNFFNLFVWGKKRDREEITNRQATYFQAIPLLQNVLQLGEGEPGPGGILQVVHNLDTCDRILELEKDHPMVHNHGKGPSP